MFLHADKIICFKLGFKSVKVKEGHINKDTVILSSFQLNQSASQPAKLVRQIDKVRKYKNIADILAFKSFEQ